MSKVAVIGESMVELYRNKDGLYKQTFGGDTLNFSVYFKRSFEETEVEYVTVLGEDEWSKNMIAFFHKQKIKTSYVDKLENKSPSLYMINTTNGERSFSYWRDESAARNLFLTESLNILENELLTFELIYFSAIILAIMSEESRNNLFRIIKKVREAGVKVAFDSNYRPKLYNSIDEAKHIYNQAINNCDISAFNRR